MERLVSSANNESKQDLVSILKHEILSVDKQVLEIENSNGEMSGNSIHIGKLYMLHRVMSCYWVHFFSIFEYLL